MREVVLKLTTQKDLVKHQSAASTFGQLKKELKQIKWSGMRVVERATKATFQMDDTVLPQGDFVLFLVPEKVKSGKKTDGGMSELPKPIEDCSYNECRSHMSWLNREKDAGLDMSGGTAALQMELDKYYKKNPSDAGAAKTGAPEKKSPKPKAEKVEEYKPTAREDDEDDEDYEDRIAFEKKAFEKKAKKAAAKAEEERLAKEKAEKEAKEKAEKEAAEKEKASKSEPKKKKGIFGKKQKDEEAPAITDPIQIIEDSREKINKAVDQIVLDMIESGGTNVPPVLEYTVESLEKEVKEVHKALKTSRSQAKYVD